MDPKPFISQGLPFEGGNTMTGLDSDVCKNHNKHTKKDLSSHIEDNLSRLFECLKLEYGRQILVSPKWKNFGSQTLQLSEKTRLNNAIWRCWHIQYQKNKKPLFCQFVSPLSQEREPPKKPLTVILQGRYWRRKLDAIAREYKKWRIYYMKQKNQEQELEDNHERQRSLSTSSGDDETSRGSPLTQVVNLMDLELTTDLVQSHPDTLFTTKTKTTSRETMPTVSEIVFQPSLDSLQPNLDEFTKHLESLVDGIVNSNEPIQLPNSFLVPRQSVQVTNVTSYQRGQEQVEMMEQSSNYDQLYSMETTETTLVNRQVQGQSFMDTTDNYSQYPMDYNNQMELQPSQPLSHEGLPLSQLQEDIEQEIFSSQTLTSPIQIPHSTLPSSQSSSHQIITNPIEHDRIPYRHSSSNLLEYSTSPTRKGKLPRNVSDNQLSMIDSSQLNLNLPFVSSQEKKIPAKDQFPNLVAYLQSTSGHSDTTASQAKRPRIPRNMSDSRLYNSSRMCGSIMQGTNPLSYQHNFAATSPPQQTPLEQIQAQAQLQQAQGVTNTTFSAQPKHQSGRVRRGKLPRNMSDSSLMYMNQQQMPITFTGTSSQRRKSSDLSRVMSPPPPSSSQSAHPVFSSTFAEAHQVNEAMRQGSSINPNTEPFEQIMDQLVQMSSSSSPPNTAAQTNVQESNVHVSTVLSQLLQSDDNLESQKDSNKEQDGQVMKQVLHLLQKQIPQSKQTPNQEVSSSWESPSPSQQPSELMSLLQGSTPPQQTLGVMTSHNVTPQHVVIHSQQHQQQLQPQQVIQQLKHKDEQVFPLEQQLQQQLIQQQQQLQQQVQQNHQSSQLISALQSTNKVLQQHLSHPQQFQQLMQQQTVSSQQPQTMVFTGKQDCITKAVNIQPKPPTILIASQPQSSTNMAVLSQQPVNMTPLPSNLMSIHQILQANPVSQVGLPYKVGSTDPGIVSLASSAGQQTKVINSSVDSFSQSLFATNASSAVTTSDTTMIATVSSAVDQVTGSPVAFSPTFQVSSPPSLKFTRPVSAADRDNYKEHRRQSHISAEQKRRFNIKIGFDQLVNLVPALASQKNSKVSKATILQKSADYINKLQRERDKVLEEQQLLRKESQQLFNSISVCQQQLPAFGVPVTRQRADQMVAFFNQYIKTRTQENYKFWILAVMFRQMFESYNQKVSGTTWEEFCTSILSWMDEQCTLPTLRPAVLSALRDISRTTSILTVPANVPQEIQRHVASHDDPSNLSQAARTTACANTSTAKNFFSNTMS